LRSAGIEFRATSWVDLEETLEVSVKVLANSFRVSVRFWRGVEYKAKGKKHMVYAPVYLDGTFGTHGYDRYYIINSVGEQVEKFLNEYLLPTRLSARQLLFQESDTANSYNKCCQAEKT